MGFYVQDDFWEALEEMPADVQNEVFGALTRTFFTGDADAEMNTLKGASKAVYIALRDRVLMARKKSTAGSKRKQNADQNTDQNANQNGDQTANQSGDQNGIKTEGVLLKSESESKRESKKENTLVVANAPTKVKGVRFTPPTPSQVEAYAKSRGQTIDAERFCDFYASKGWRVGNSPMKDWKAATRTWLARDRPKEVTLDAEAEFYASLV